MKISALISDVDGTLVTHDKMLTDAQPQSGGGLARSAASTSR